MTNTTGSVYELRIPTSSERFKYRFKPLTDEELDDFFRIAETAIGTFKWKVAIGHDHMSPFYRGVRDWGGIAERFDEAGLEAFVFYDEDPDNKGVPRPRTLAYEKMVVPLIAEAGRLRKENTELKTRMERLESRMVLLEERAA